MQQYLHGRSPSLPYTINLAEQPSIELQQWLRVVPNRRYVAKAQWQGKSVLVKLFLGKRANKALQREQRGAEALNQQALPTAKLLLTENIQSKLSVAVFEFLEGESLYSYWQRINSDQESVNEQQMQLLKRVICTVADMHISGVYQEDLHLENFFQTPTGLRLIDVASIKQQTLGRIIKRKTILQNLAVFFAQLPRAIDPAIEELMDSYYRKTAIKSFAVEILQQEVNAIRLWRAKDMVEKTARDTTIFAYQKTPNYVQSVLRKSLPDVAEILEAADQLIEGGHIYKTGGSATVAKINYFNTNYIVKRNNIKNFKHFLKRFWRKSRSWHGYQAAVLLDMLEVPTCKVYGVRERRVLGARMQAWLVTEYSGEEHLYQRFSPYVETGDVPEAELQSLVALFESMIREKISHGDCKAYNIFWHNNRFELIDLDSVRLHRSHKSFRKAFRKDRARLLRNWPKESALYQLLDKKLPMV